MCVILILEKGYTPPYDYIENASFNNPHGYGLILKAGKRLQVIKKCVPGKENDPKEVYDLLKDNEDIERFLHLRWKTEGPIDEDNTHPFCSYYTDKKQVYFMHNGTLYDYRPRTGGTTYVNGEKREEAAENISDSKKFNDEFLFPLMNNYVGGKGKGDISDPFLKSLIAKQWGSTGDNKGLLIPNDQEYVMINSARWKKIELPDGKFWASNDTYFKEIIRGPEYDRRKAEKEKEDKGKESRFRGSSEWPLTPLKDVDLAKQVALKDNLKDFFNDAESWDEEGMASLENVTRAEFHDFCDKYPEEAAFLLEMITCYFANLLKRYTRATHYLRKLNADGKTDVTIEDIEKAAS